MLIASLFFSLMGFCVRLLKGMPFMEVVVFRSAVSFVLSAGLLRARGGSLLGTHRSLLTLRGLFGFAGLSAYFFTLHALPLAEAVTVQYTNPLFTALFAPWILRERGSGREWGASALAFAGVVLIADPRVPAHILPVLVGLGGAMCSGIAYNLVRRLATAGEDPLTIVMYFPIVSVVLGVPFAAMEWRTPDLRALLLLLGVGVATQIAQVSMTRGLRTERAARATVVNYLIIAFSTLLSLTLGEIPPPLSLAGMALIVTAIVVLTLPRTTPEAAHA